MSRDITDHELSRRDVADEEARVRCTECGVTFRRGEVEATKKGTLSCPDCGSRRVEAVE